MMTIAAFLKEGILPIIQNIFSSYLFDRIKDLISEDDGSENDAFRKEMREAFVRAVKKVKVNADDQLIEKYKNNEFKYYQKVALEEYIKLQPSDKKKFINQDLYNAFKFEIEQKTEILQNLSLSVAQECLNNQQIYSTLLSQLCESIPEIKQSIDAIWEENLNRAFSAGMTPSKIVTELDLRFAATPDLHSERSELIERLKLCLIEHHSMLLYAGFKDGKTVTSELLSKSINNYKHVWLYFAYENTINLVKALEYFDKQEKIMFILDGIKYDNWRLYDSLYRIVNENCSENWLFLINSYDKISNLILNGSTSITEIELPPLNKKEIEEMIPEEKQEMFSDFIYNRFKGQPFLTYIICAYLADRGWSENVESMDMLFSFPNNTKMQKKVIRITQQMVEDEEAYHLLNRLLLLEKPFTEDECCRLASISPIILNPRKKIEILCGAWIKEKDGVYEISHLLQQAMTIDLLPQEKNECCLVIAKLIINQPNGITMNDAFKIFTLLNTTKNEQEVASFYVSFLNKLDELKMLDRPETLLWKLIWMDVPLPEWMSAETKVFIRVSQLLILVIKRGEQSDFIVTDIEDNLKKIQEKSVHKSLAARILGIYFLLNDESTKALDYRELFLHQEMPIKDLENIDDNKFFMLSLNGVKTSDDLKRWSDSFMKAGSPEIDLMPDGMIMAINRLCDRGRPNELRSMLEELCHYGTMIGFNCLVVVSCAKLIDFFSEEKQIEEAHCVFNKYKNLLKTDLGDILLNYSYGLMLFNNGAVNEGVTYIEKASNPTHIPTLCAVVLNATTTLCQIKANQGKQEEALDLLLRLRNNHNYKNCYTDVEQTMIEGTLSYAYWMVGQRKNALNSLLKVVEWMKREHANQSNDYKNISIRTTILVRFMYCELHRKEHSEEFALPDYGIYTKLAPSLLDEYKTERNFVVMYYIYELAEYVLQNDKESLKLIDEILVLQRSDASSMAELLTVMIQSFPLCIRNNRRDLIEYILLGALAGFAANKKDNLVDKEGTILHTTIACIVMDRVCRIAKDDDVDDEWFFELIQKSLVYLPDHKRTDEMINQMSTLAPNYDNVFEELSRCIIATFHYKTLDIADALYVLYSMGYSLLKYNTMPSAEHLTKDFSRAFAYLIIKEHPEKFSLDIENFDSFFNRISTCSGIEYLRGVLQGLHFKLKSDIVLPKEVKDFIDN